MIPSPIASTTYHQPRYLAVELINMILENVKRPLDLANCCRVNKDFKKLCQPSLYRHLRISCCTPLIAPDDYISGYVLSESSKLLFRTLEGNKVLRQYPRKLTLDADGDAEQEWIVDDDGQEGDSEVEEGDESRGHYEFNSEFEDPSEPFERCLRLLPKIDAVDLDSLVWWWRPVRDVVFNHGERWKEIKVSGELLTEEGDERDLSVLSRLEKLECERIGETDLDDQYLPSRLRTLDARDCSLPAGDPSSNYKLHKVLTALTAETIAHLSSYQNLQRLHLYQNWDDLEPPLPDVLPGFQSLPALHFLCLSLDKLRPASPQQQRLFSRISLLRFRGSNSSTSFHSISWHISSSIGLAQPRSLWDLRKTRFGRKGVRRNSTTWRYSVRKRASKSICSRDQVIAGVCPLTTSLRFLPLTEAPFACRQLGGNEGEGARVGPSSLSFLFPFASAHYELNTKCVSF